MKQIWYKKMHVYDGILLGCKKKKYCHLQQHGRTLWGLCSVKWDRKRQTPYTITHTCKEGKTKKETNKTKWKQTHPYRPQTGDCKRERGGREGREKWVKEAKGTVKEGSWKVGGELAIAHTDTEWLRCTPETHTKLLTNVTSLKWVSNLIKIKWKIKRRWETLHQNLSPWFFWKDH